MDYDFTNDAFMAEQDGDYSSALEFGGAAMEGIDTSAKNFVHAFADDYTQEFFQPEVVNTMHNAAMGSRAASTRTRFPSVVKLEPGSAGARRSPTYNDFDEGSLDVIVEKEPPEAVRKRTPQENRTFGCIVRIPGHDLARVEKLRVVIAYADGDILEGQDILGGDRVVPVRQDGRARFDKLCMKEASTKHSEREFVLRFIAVCANGEEILCRGNTNAFYAYSNRKVLERRRNIMLRALSSATGDVRGGEPMHVVGRPFISSSALTAVFRTETFGDIPVETMSLFSDTVLEFVLPKVPGAEALPPGTEIRADFIVSNDGHTYSNPIPFKFVCGASLYLRSRY